MIVQFNSGELTEMRAWSQYSAVILLFLSLARLCMTDDTVRIKCFYLGIID